MAESLSLNHKYFILKFISLAVYGYFLFTFNLLGLEARMKMFFVLTPIFKLFNWIIGNNKRPLTQIFFSIITDCLYAYFYFTYILSSFKGALFAFTPLYAILNFTIIEFIEFRFWPEGKYLLKLSKNLSDFIIAPLIILLFYYIGTVFPQEHEFKWYTFSWMIFWVISMDIFFGFVHTLLHKNRYLWETHQTHHEYKKEDVCMFTTFYADFIDGFLEVSSIVIPPLIFQRMFGIECALFNLDALSSAFNTHNKFVTNHISSFYYFEYDLFDLTIGKILGLKTSQEFHLDHHLDVNINFSAYGLISDDIHVSVAKKLFDILGITMLTDEESSKFK